MDPTVDAMGQSSSHGHHSNRQGPSSSSSSSKKEHKRNGSISMNGCNGGLTPKGLLRRASSLTGTPSGKLRSLRSPFGKRKNKKGGPLSATFTAPNASNVEQMDINSATEEQLMTLPGIDRTLAQNIVEYRGRIGGRFQRIDDLALVSGMGAARLDKIRSEVCVLRPQRRLMMVGQASLNGSLSSRTPSIDSVSTNANMGDMLSAGSSTPAPRTRLARVNINAATVFDLQQIVGLNQELAAKIVEYRNRKGYYKTVDHLMKVKGISSRRLVQIRPHVSVISEDTMSFHSLTSTPMKPSTLLANTPYSNGLLGMAESAPPTPGPLSNRKSVSVPMRMNYKLVNGFKNAPVDDIFELLGAYSHRPMTATDDFRYERNGRKAIRVASWNLDRLSMAKADNPGVLEVICRTILENKLSIICVQEVTDVKALAKICDELNEPMLKRVLEWRENSRRWKYFAAESCKEGRINGLGFIYDNHQCRFLPKLSHEMDLSLENVATETSPASYLGVFELDDWTLTVLNLYLRYFDLTRTNEIVERLKVSLQDAPVGFENVYLVVGDFTGLANGASEIEASTATNRLLNGNNNNNRQNSTESSTSKRCKINWSVDEDSMDGGGGSNGMPDDEEDEELDENQNEAITVDDIFNVFQYCQVFEANKTSFVDLANSDEIDDGLNMCHAPPKNVKKSSCNILCRDKLPALSDPFREAIYRTKSPFELPKVPSTTNSDTKTEKLTGYSSVIREGLCHMAIPRDWTWGGPASDHCPVWIECYRRVKRDNLRTLVRENGTRAGATSNAVTIITEAMNGVSLLSATRMKGSCEAITTTNGVGTKRQRMKRSDRSSSNGGSSTGGGSSSFENERSNGMRTTVGAVSLQ